jgi:hypothetical protein
VVAAGTLIEPLDGSVTAHVLGLIGSQHPVTAVLGLAAMLPGWIIKLLRKEPDTTVNMQPTPVGAASIIKQSQSRANR